RPVAGPRGGGRDQPATAAGRTGLGLSGGRPRGATPALAAPVGPGPPARGHGLARADVDRQPVAERTDRLRRDQRATPVVLRPAHAGRAREQAAGDVPDVL